MGGFGNILDLDRMGIYGSDIYVLWSDICDRNVAKMITILRAAQLGFISDKLVADAAHRQDYSGVEMIDISGLYAWVKERLPNFDPDNLTGITIIKCDIIPELPDEPLVPEDPELPDVPLEPELPEEPDVVPTEDDDPYEYIKGR